MTVLRSATAADLDAIVSIEMASNPTPWRRTQFLDELQHDDANVRVVDAQIGADAPLATVGFCCVRQIVDRVELLSIAVLPAARRRGIAKRLVADALGWSAARGAVAVDLELRASNRAALACYERAGFVVVGERPRYYRDPTEAAVLMTYATGLAQLQPVPPQP